MSTRKRVNVNLKKKGLAFINKQGNFVTEEYIEYIKPLIGEHHRYSKLKFDKKQIMAI